MSFIVGVLAFVLVFSYLAANFDYPEILGGSTADPAVQPIADLNSTLLPLRMIVLGVFLILRSKEKAA